MEGEPLEMPPVEPFDLSGLTLDGIRQLHRDFFPYGYDEPIDDQDTANEPLLQDLCEGYCQGLVNLCTQNPDLAMATLKMFGTSEFADERLTVACMLDSLLKVNREAGMSFAELLLRDDDDEVSGHAIVAIDSAWESETITFADLCRFCDIYNEGNDRPEGTGE